MSVNRYTICESVSDTCQKTDKLTSNLIELNFKKLSIKKILKRKLEYEKGGFKDICGILKTPLGYYFKV